MRYGKHLVGEVQENVDRLAGAANVWWWEKAEWWTREGDCAKTADLLAEAGFDVTLVLLPEGERAKTLEVAAATWRVQARQWKPVWIAWLSR